MIKELLEKLNIEFTTLLPYIEEEINKLNNKYAESFSSNENFFSEKDTILITYADQFNSDKENNIQSLKKFLDEDLEGCMSIVHILPFYPWTSDDGFSPIDYKKVCSDYGEWDDIEQIKQKTMFDCVFNHISASSPFFQKALDGDSHCENMFHVVSSAEYKQPSFQEKVKNVVRPRTSDLFSEYQFNSKTKYVWTTFSKDQIDTNLSNITMFRYILESFFLYIEKGAQYFRIDAVPFMWKEIGTNCSHLENTHNIVKLFRAITEKINKNLYIITESNVPHKENISYWGNHNNEAHLIYNFSLAPLILHGILCENSKYLNSWATNVFTTSEQTTFLNFTATHDGIGMRGLEGIVPEDDVKKLCQIAVDKGGKIGTKVSRDGTTRPYELNITWASIMDDSTIDRDTYIRKVVNSHAITMFFPGIGAHYVHNFFGTKNWLEGVKESGIARRVNRKKHQYPLNLDHTTSKIMRSLIELVQYKSSNSLFAPQASFQILATHEKCLSFKRFSGSDNIEVHFNLSKETISLLDFQLKPYELKFK